MPEPFRPIEITSIQEIDPYTGGRNPKYQFHFQGKYQDTNEPVQPVKPDADHAMFKTTKQAVRQALAPGLVVFAQIQSTSSGFTSYWIDKAERIQGTAQPAAQPASQPATSQAQGQASQPTPPAASESPAPAPVMPAPQAAIIDVDTAPMTMCLSYAKDIFIAMLEESRAREEQAPGDNAITAYADLLYDWYQQKVTAARESAQTKASKEQERMELLTTIRDVMTPDVRAALEQTDIEDEILIDWWHQSQHHERNFRRRVEDELVQLGVLQ